MIEPSLTTSAPEPEYLVDCGKYGEIPVRTLWLLYLYASKLYQYMRQQDRDKAEKNPDELPELLAEILAYIAERRMRRSLNLGYRQRSAHLNRVRGRIKFLETERHQLLARGKIACEFEELTADIPRNRYVRVALLTIARKVDSRRAGGEHNKFHNQNIASRCRKVATMMGQLGVKNIRPRDDEVFSVRSSHHDAEDDYMLIAAKFAFDLSLPNREQGGWRFTTPPTPNNLPKLFESAITSFYYVALKDIPWVVHSQTPFNWPIPIGGKKSVYLPTMKPDIVLKKGNHRIVIDTKYKEALTSPKKDSPYSEKFLSEDLYQIYTYLRSQEDCSDDAKHTTGILLYRQRKEEKPLSEVSDIQGHKVCVYTLDMWASPSEIRNRLLDILKREGLPV